MDVSKIQAKRAAIMNEHAKTKWSVMKVQGAETKKRQKTPNKVSIREALEAMTEEDGDVVKNKEQAENQDSMEEDGNRDFPLPNLGPKPLTGTQDKAH
jgi:hypothetical protein